MSKRINFAGEKFLAAYSAIILAVTPKLDPMMNGAPISGNTTQLFPFDFVFFKKVLNFLKNISSFCGTFHWLKCKQLFSILEVTINNSNKYSSLCSINAICSFIQRNGKAFKFLYKFSSHRIYAPSNSDKADIWISSIVQKSLLYEDTKF